MEEKLEDESELTDLVELLSDGDNLLIFGEDKRSVEDFLNSKGLLDHSRPLRRQRLVEALRSSAKLVKTFSDAAVSSSQWLKLTPEAVAAIKEYGLTKTDTDGIAYAMAGDRGDIKGWLKIETSIRAQLSNPGILSSAAGMLSQAARQQEVAELRNMLESLDHKIGQVLRGQEDDILGDLEGIEDQIRATKRRLEIEKEVDDLTWSTLFGTSVDLRQVQAKALRRVRGIAEDLEDQSRFGELKQRLFQAQRGVHQWLSAVSRCVIALDDLAILELDYLAVRDPDRLDARRSTLNLERQEDREALDRRVAVLMQRLDEAAETANQNTLFHKPAVRAALDSIELTRGLVHDISEGFGIDVSWDSVIPLRWRQAVLQPQQWNNGLREGGSVALEKVRDNAIPLTIGAGVFLIKAAKQQKPGGKI